MTHVERRSFLSAKECHSAYDQVMGLLPYWRKLHWPKSRGRAPFYMLGCSSYSCRERPAEYKPGYRLLNPLLWTGFEWIYLRLQNLLESKLKRPVRFRKDAALPGFHIFFNHPIFKKVPNQWHFDQDYLLLKWKHHIGLEDCVSFTLPISIPESGAALDVLDLNFSYLSKYRRHQWPTLIKKADYSSFPHRLGKLMIQDGLRLHRIAPLRRVGKKNEARITFQGLAVRQGAHWEIFW